MQLNKSVSVKTLADFSAKSGSLYQKFTPSPTALEGMEGHKKVTSERTEAYKTEITLNIYYKGLHIRGRADGYDADRQCLEEIKTFYGDFEKIHDNQRALHWAQLKIYGWMLCTQGDRQDINLALIYFHLGDQKEYRIEKNFTAKDLSADCEILAEKYYQWQLKINARLQMLNDWSGELVFPHAELHGPQRIMAETVYKAAMTGRIVFAEAPTGTGKTLAALFPSIKSLHKSSVDKIFYLTAKTTGKHLALENARLIASDATPLRVLELTAREKICLEPDKQCSGDSCPFALDFYNKLAHARYAAFQIPVLDKQSLTQLAYQYSICPFYLATEMSRWVDIIIADFNYYFDSSALLFGLTKEFDWNPCLLVDESHNLLERSRQMYSASLNRGLLRNAKLQAPPILRKSLERINRIWLAIIKDLTNAKENFSIVEKIQPKFFQALNEFINQYTELLQRDPEHSVQQTQVRDIFFDILNFLVIVEYLDTDFCIDMQQLHSKNEILTLRNLIPARILATRLAAAHCGCFFSATLRPAYFYQSMLGLPDDTISIKVPSPFQARQLDVNIAKKLSTRYHDRSRAVESICAIIKDQLLAQNGNALIFFSSYDFLHQVEPHIHAALSDMDIKIVVQSRYMNDDMRQDFIDQFHKHTNIFGLAVLGGAFGEGIDLPGNRLKGVFIATLGLPQVNPINEYMRYYLQNRFQQGYNFTYLYPGIQKVIQAAGRVIRTRQDEGYVWLLDERFMQPEIKALLPEWWEIKAR